jgi:hypothetical protein
MLSLKLLILFIFHVTINAYYAVQLEEIDVFELRLYPRPPEVQALCCINFERYFGKSLDGYPRRAHQIAGLRGLVNPKLA